MSIEKLVRSLVLSPSYELPFRLSFRRRRARVRGLTVAELLAVVETWPASSAVVWGVCRMVAMPETMSGTDQRALFELVRIATGVRDPFSTARLHMLGEAQLTTLLRTVVEATMPSGMDELFETSGETAPRRDDDLEELSSGVADEPAVVLSKLVVVMAAKGFPDAIHWTPGRLLYASSVLGEDAGRDARRRLHDAAVAVRAGGATDKGWEAFEAALKEAR